MARGVILRLLNIDRGADEPVAVGRLAGLGDEDVARLSPLGHVHINMLGRYAFTLPEIIARGELRPLRDPRTAGIDDL